MNLYQRALAARAAIGLLAFNPHQKRGPDGRWIKMGDSELKRPRRPSTGPRATHTEDHPLYRRRRNAYNDRIARLIDDLKARVDPQFSDLIEQYDAAEPGERRDSVADQLRVQLKQRLGDYAPLPPEPSRNVPIARGRGRGGPRPDLDAPYPQRRSALQRSVNSGAVEEVPLSQGQMSETRRYHLADGTEVISKQIHRDEDWGGGAVPWRVKDQLDAEELSAALAQALGVRAPAVVREGDDTIYMDVMPGTEGLARWPDRREPPRGVVYSPEGLRIGVLDTLIENSDRHGGNYLVDDKDELSAIDHGLAFHAMYEMRDGQPQVKTDLRSPQVVSPFARGPFIDGWGYVEQNPLTDGDIKQLRRRVASVRRQFERLGRQEWYEQMVRRLDLLAANAGGTGPGLYN